MYSFQQPHTDVHRGPPPPAADFRSSTLQPDPHDASVWLRRPAAMAPAQARPRWLVPALVATVVALTLAAAGFAWRWG